MKDAAKAMAEAGENGEAGGPRSVQEKAAKDAEINANKAEQQKLR